MLEPRVSSTLTYQAVRCWARQSPPACPRLPEPVVHALIHQKGRPQHEYKRFLLTSKRPQGQSDTVHRDPKTKHGACWQKPLILFQSLGLKPILVHTNRAVHANFQSFAFLQKRPSLCAYQEKELIAVMPPIA